MQLKHGLLGLFITLLATTGCDSKFKDCQTVIDSINASVERIKKAEVGGSEPEKMAKQFQDFAKIAEEEADKLGGIKVETPELKGMVDEYATMAKEVAGAAKELAGAMEELTKIAKDAETKPSPDLLDKMKEVEKKGDAAQKKLDAATSKEDPLVDKINKFCGAS